MTQPIQLNQEISQKYDSYSNRANKDNLNTLDEPVLVTIKRDVWMIGQKIQTTLSGSGDYEKLQREWDLGGPLFISLISAGIAALRTSGTSQDAFTVIFLLLWIGPIIIAVNSRLLGSKINIIQTMCLIIYCSAPIMFLTILIAFIGIIITSFFINLSLSVGAIVFTLRCNYQYFKNLSTPEKQYLNLYPVLLFYTSICLYISIT